MTDMYDFITEERAKVIFQLCEEERSVVSMETCRKIARLWLDSDRTKQKIVSNILDGYDDEVD